MKLSNEKSKALCGFILHGGINCLLTTANLATGNPISVIAALASTITGNLASNHFGKMGDKLLERLRIAEPDKVNHDLERLLRETVVVALQFIKTLFLKEIKKDESLKDELDVEGFKNFIQGLTLFFDENIADIRDLMQSEIREPLDKALVKEPQEFLNKIIDQIFNATSIEFDATTKEHLKNFYSEKLPFCFELAFKEALKKDEVAFKAFQIWTFEEMQKQNVLILEGQQRIEDVIEHLKLGGKYLTEQQRDEALEKQAERIYELLEKDFSGITILLKDLALSINKNFEKQYQLSEAIESDVKENLIVSKKTTENVIAIKEMLTAVIDGKMITYNPCLTTPPFMSQLFIGRDEELKTVKNMLFAGNLLLLVNGKGGVGKTTLAAKYYHTYQSLYTHTAWVLNEKSITNAILLLAVPLNLEFEQTMNSQERLDKLLSIMAGLKSPCLLVIDNVDDYQDLEDNYQTLRRCSNFHLLITSRLTKFEQAERYKIEGLRREEALQLFKKYYSRHIPNEDALFYQIYDAVDGNTLVLELLAKNLKIINQLKINYTLTNLTEDLRKGLLSISKSVAVGGVDYHSKAGIMRKEKPEEIIEAMYDLTKLSNEEINLLSIFALLPAENILYEVLVSLLPEMTLDEILLALAQKGWLDYNETNTSFKISPVIQDIVRKKNIQLIESSQPLLLGLINKLEHEGNHIIGCTYQEATLFARYAESVIYKLNIADEAFVILIDRVGRYNLIIGNLNKALKHYENEIILLEAFHESYPQNLSFKDSLAISYQSIGHTQASLGNLDKALGYFEQYNQFKKELYEAYPQNLSFKKGLAVSYSKLGEIQGSIGDLGKALKHYEQCNQISKELYEAYPQNVSFKNQLAVSYLNLGETQLSLDNLDKALEHFRQFMQLEKELYEAYPQNVSFKDALSISYQFLGHIQTSFGNLKEALEHYERYNQLAKELYEAYPQNVSFKNGLAVSYSKLGDLQILLNNLDKALTYYERDNQLAKELYEAYPQTVNYKRRLSTSYSKLGQLQSLLNNLDKALTYYEQNNQLAKELYEAYSKNVSFKNGLAVSYANLGAFYHDNSLNEKKAFQYLKNAAEIWEELTTAAPGYAEFQKSLERIKEALIDLSAGV